jgi:hypothetical protein
MEKYIEKYYWFKFTEIQIQLIYVWNITNEKFVTKNMRY